MALQAFLGLPVCVDPSSREGVGGASMLFPRQGCLPSSLRPGSDLGCLKEKGLSVGGSPTPHSPGEFTVRALGGRFPCFPAHIYLCTLSQKVPGGALSLLPPTPGGQVLESRGGGQGPTGARMPLRVFSPPAVPTEGVTTTIPTLS